MGIYPDIRGNGLLIEMVDDICTKGEFDQKNYKSYVNIIQLLTLKKYVKTIKKIDDVREYFQKVDVVSFVEYMKETALVFPIGYYLLNNVRIALHLRDKGLMKKAMDDIKHETARLDAQSKLNMVGFKCNITQTEAYEILRNYMGNKARDCQFIKIYENDTNIIDASYRFTSPKQGI